jgi:hypothetical protein
LIFVCACIVDSPGIEACVSPSPCHENDRERLKSPKLRRI